MANEKINEAGKTPRTQSQPVQKSQPVRIEEGKTAGRPAPSRK